MAGVPFQAGCTARGQRQVAQDDADARALADRLTLLAPAPLTDGHDLASLASESPALDDWLRRRARANQAAGASRCYVACAGDRVVAFYALAAGSVSVAAAAGKFRRNMPDPIPVIVLGRLAIDRAWQGRGLGRALVRDAGLRVLQAAEVVGVRGLLVHALTDDARSFYLATGFGPSPMDAMTLMVTVDDLRRTLVV
ncbi:MAG: GNAT family N-acetyltransferase [Gemmobacter sp.]